MHSSAILLFYRHLGTDHRGRTLRDIRQFDHIQLEHRHDFIQWLFPLPEGSGVLLQAPRLTREDCHAFRTDRDLRDELRASLKLMLDFYGLELVNGPVVQPSATFEKRRLHWLVRNNHNHLRLSRMIRSCALLGLMDEAAALKRCLLELARQYPEGVSERTVQIWSGETEG